jgi:hypothetical protein
MRSSTRLLGGIVGILAAGLLATPVAAASPSYVSKESGTSAYAYTEECADNTDGTVTCESSSLDVFKGVTKQSGLPTFRGDRACYSSSTYTFDPNSGTPGESNGLFGCAFHSGTLRINRLISISLAPTSVELTRVECSATECTETPAGTITISGTWTGVGPTSTSKGRFRFDDGTCVQVNAERSRSRQATFVGTLAGANARMATGSFSFRSNCEF